MDESVPTRNDATGRPALPGLARFRKSLSLLHRQETSSRSLDVHSLPDRRRTTLTPASRPSAMPMVSRAVLAYVPGLT